MLWLSWIAACCTHGLHSSMPSKCDSWNLTFVLLSCEKIHNTCTCMHVWHKLGWQFDAWQAGGVDCRSSIMHILEGLRDDQRHSCSSFWMSNCHQGSCNPVWNTNLTHMIPACAHSALNVAPHEPGLARCSFKMMQFWTLTVNKTTIKSNHRFKIWHKFFFECSCVDIGFWVSQITVMLKTS